MHGRLLALLKSGQRPHSWGSLHLPPQAVLLFLVYLDILVLRKSQALPPGPSVGLAQPLESKLFWRWRFDNHSSRHGRPPIFCPCTLFGRLGRGYLPVCPCGLSTAHLHLVSPPAPRECASAPLPRARPVAGARSTQPASRSDRRCPTAAAAAITVAVPPRVVSVHLPPPAPRRPSAPDWQSANPPDPSLPVCAVRFLPLSFGLIPPPPVK